MKLLHISDLHIGRKLKGYSLISDQKYILEQILNIALKEKIKGIIIAGDIYDSSIPSIEAINLFDEFISEIHKNNISCYIVSGNHDSIQRISFLSDIIAQENIYFAKKYSGTISPIEIDKNILIWLIPFVRPIDVREYHNDFKISDYEEMMQTIISNIDIDENKTNILVLHQFVVHKGQKPQQCESEILSLGTLDNIDTSNFKKFDYVALGHIHKPQKIGHDNIRYSGSPLKYSFSEKNDIKSAILLEIKNKKIKTKLIPLKPLKDMEELIGTYEELIQKKSDNYVKIVLKDTNYINDIKHKLDKNYKNILEITYDNIKNDNENKKTIDIKNKTPLELFKDFYKTQNDKELTLQQIELIQKIMEDINNNAPA